MEKRARHFIITINNADKQDFDNIKCDYKAG